jgi:hypothetical protein
MGGISLLTNVEAQEGGMGLAIWERTLILQGFMSFLMINYAFGSPFAHEMGRVSTAEKSAIGDKDPNQKSRWLFRYLRVLGLNKLQLWEQTIFYARHLVNAHVLNMIGMSSDTTDDSHFIVFDGGCVP